jgi:hypothetical protein
MFKQIIAKNDAPRNVAEGQKAVFTIVKGEHVRVRETLNDQPRDAANVMALRKGQDLILKFADATEIQFEGFFVECGANGCSVTLGGDDGAGFALHGDSAVGVPTVDGLHVLYAHGYRGSLMGLARGDADVSRILGSLGQGLVTYVPANGSVAGSEPCVGFLS